MAILTGLAIGAGTAVISKGLGMIGNSSRKQIRQQQKLTDMQKDANADLMRQSYGLQKNMYDHQFDKNTPEAMRKLYEQAGMNPALAYTQGGVGGVSGGSGGASVGGAQAADEAAMGNMETNRTAMALQMGMMESQIKVNESVAEKNVAEAEKAGAQTTTEEEQRDILTSNLKRLNDGMFMEQMEKRFKQSTQYGNEYVKDNGISNTNEATGLYHVIMTDSSYGQMVTNEVLKAQAETGNIMAQEALSNKKAQGYFKELLIKQQEADQDGMKAAAMKLASEWTTGELTNWKTWVDVGETSGKLLLEAFKAGMGAKKGGK